MNVVMRLGVRGLNHLIAAERWAQELLARQAGRQLRICAGLLDLHLAIDSQGLFAPRDAAGAPDVTLTLPADFPLRALLDRGTLFSAVRLEGSVDLAETLAFVFRNLKWDVEADLADLIGDIPAFRLVRIGRALGHGLQQAVRKLADNFREYGVEETAILVSPAELAQFGAAVSQIRDDVARLEKRLDGF